MRSILQRFAVASFAGALMCISAEAQTPPPMVPAIDPARALTGGALVEALRRGGFVLYLRHARQAGPQDDGPCTHENLAAESPAQVKRVAEALNERRIPVGRVLASPFCRAVETAKLLGLGEPEITDDLRLGAPGTPEIHAARARRLAQVPPAGSNTLLVSHGHSSADVLERMQLDLLEIVVFHPEGDGKSTVVARIRTQDWETLPR